VTSRCEGGQEERQTDQMVDVAVAQKQIDIDRRHLVVQGIAEHAQSGPGIENQTTVAALDLNA
jgi:hypothetical protein